MAHDAPIDHREDDRSAVWPPCEEMSDPPEERQRWPLLSDALEICERTVNKVYQAADEEA
jgi:hypothetical protein